MTDADRNRAEKIKEILKNQKVDIIPKEELKIEDKHLKGYIYDSLVYRYIRAREAMAEYEWSQNNNHDRIYYHDLAKRDIMRFIQILDEAIGEHD